MKTARMTMTAAIAALMFTFGSAHAGDLTPPGAPGSTMKTLDQVEPRIPVSSAPVTLSAPGSYYLTANLSGTVMIAADNVTLDLMGYAIVSASGSAIRQSGSRMNLVVRNGIVSAPSGNGADLSASVSGANGILEDLRVTECNVYGLAVGSGFTVRRCHISGVTLAGIRGYGDSRIIGNTVVNSGTGIQLSGTGAYVAENIVKGNTDNYNFTTGNQLNLLLCEIPEALDWPCSVKLAGTLSTTNTGVNGITVAANDVTIDMAGHTLVGPGESSGHGISQDSVYRNLRVFNGKVVDWRGYLRRGIYAFGSSAILSDLQSSTNYYGIMAGSGCTISDCAAKNNDSYGIFTSSGCTLSGCAAENNGGDGIYAGSGSTLSGCVASFNTGDGIQVYSDSLVTGCVCDNNGYNGDGAGIHATSSDNRIEGNTCTDNDRGNDVDSPGNFIVKNSCSGNTLNWNVAAGNVCLVVNAATTAGAISGNFGGTAPGSTDPNANFTY